MAIEGLGIRYSPYTYKKSEAKEAQRTENEAEEKDTGITEAGAKKDASQLKFDSKKQLMDYLKDNFKTVASGMTQISGAYLNKCLKDEGELQKLLDNLAAADEMAENAPDEIKGYQGMKISIDENGEMETETYGGSVSINEGKRLRQIAAAKTPAQIQMVLSLLNVDLSDVKRGKAQGMCDDDEIAKAEALIQQAQQRSSQIQSQSDEEQTEAEKDMSFYNTLLM